MRAEGEWKVCSRCKKKLELAWFNKDKSQKDGFNHSCKECHRIYQRGRSISNKEANRIVLNGTKTCGRCKEVKDVKYFSAAYSSKDGRCSWCAMCVQVRNKERYRENLELSRERSRERRYDYYWKSDGRLVIALKNQAKRGYA